MIEGLTPTAVTQSEALTEVSLLVTAGADIDLGFTLTVILVVGPPDPNALSYLVPRAVFARGYPVHVAALMQVDDHTERMLEILAVMDPNDIAVFLCENSATVSQALRCLGAEADPQ